MQFIDTHIHLQDYKQKCATDIIAELPKFSVRRLICASIREEDWSKLAELSQKFSEIIPAFGLHPWMISEIKDGWSERLENMLQQFPQALVGETGVDKVKDKNIEPQRSIFLEHCRLAKQYCRPLLVHSVKVSDWLQDLWTDMPQKFVLHSFNGKTEHLYHPLKAGAYISFSASILHNKDGQKIVQSVPKDKLLLETDGPYQAFEKGQESDISFLPKLLAEIAQWRQENPYDMAEQIYNNSLEFIKTW